MKGSKFNIANEIFEVYNTTNEGTFLHMVKLGKKGQRLSPQNPKNLLNMSTANLERFKKLGSIKTV